MPSTNTAQQTAATVLDALDGAVTTIAPLTTGTANTVLGAIGAGLGFVAGLVRMGADPVEHITRIVNTDPLLAGVRTRWHDRMKTKFG